MTINYSVLVIGCKKHEEIAERYFKLAKKFWSNSLENTIFCTDIITEYQRNFAPMVVFDNSDSFANRILSGIEETKSEYIFLMLDDYYLTKAIDQACLDNLIAYMQQDGIEYCKLIGMPKCFLKNKGYPGTYCIKQFTHYGVSLQPSVWERSALINALKKCTGNSAWEVEAAFSIYQRNNFNKCITFNKNLLNYRNGVLRGKLFPYTNRILNKNGIQPLDFDTISRFKSFSFMARQHLAMHLPIWLRKLGKKIGKKRGKKYYSLD